MLKKALMVFMLGLPLSCAQDKAQPMDNPIQIAKYFPLKAFVEKQVELLDGSKVRKSIAIKGEEDHVEVSMDAEAWRKELDIFIQSDINKASLASSYDTEEKPGLTVHRLKSGENSSIKEIRIAYEGDQVSMVDFISHQEEIFYASRSVGHLSIDTSSGTIRSYEVSGSQKVWFLPVNEMTVRGEIL